MVYSINRRCPICGEVIQIKNIQKISFKIPKEYRLPDNYNVVVCEKCGFCYANIFANQTQYDYYYTNYNVYSFDVGTGKDGFIIDKVIMEHLNLDSSIINIGVGSGNFERRLKEKGYKNIIGIDPSLDSINMLKENEIRGIVGSIYGDIEGALMIEADALFLLATLEHLLYPLEAIENVLKYIKKGGLIFTTVPNCGNMDRNDTRVPNNFNQEHINYFSKYSMRNLFKQYGCEEIFCEEYKVGKEYGVLQVFEYNDSINNEIDKDNITEKSIVKYFERENKIKKDLIIKIDEFKESQKEFIVWGTGAYTMDLLANTSLNECNILYYVDNNPAKQGVEFSGKKIILPSKEVLDGKTILICSMLYAEEIINQIRRMEVDCECIVI